MSDQDTIPPDIELLLPWYVTGRLSASERAEVEAYLEANAEARRQLELIAEEIDPVIADNEALPTPGPGALDRLMAQVNAEAPRRATSPGGWLARIGGWFDVMSPQMRGAVAATAVVLVIAQAAVLGLTAGRDGGMFETATDGAPAAGGAQVLVSFAPEATAGEISALLDEAGARIVDGPKPGGIYALALAEGAQAEDAVRILTEREDIVSFAAPGS